MQAGEISAPGTLPTVIAVRGARHNNLRDIDVDVACAPGSATGPWLADHLGLLGAGRS